ncbi:MAG: hypothetical protein LGB66_02730 [Sulfurovum sp.]|nr:hypothetical protein [Sulfurovum sp.]MCB4765367.1 hypothetical protein [Sulfurovum sp.]MCB4766097.1 hypothetical protein [Sulfurovum sp.]MCB4775297.1 hypothetical protein [Sulfurovum sp.]MCB4782153.1 hypothetical protein [Sulfurovum sp.]
MKRITLISSAIATVLLMSGCAALSNSTQYVVRSKKVVVGFAEPEKSNNCKKVGVSTKFDAKAKNIFSIIRIGDSVEEAIHKGNVYFAKEATRKGANYVDRTFYAEKVYFPAVYSVSREATADYYKCRKIPKPNYIDHTRY